MSVVAVESSLLIAELDVLRGVAPWCGATALTTADVRDALRTRSLRCKPAEIGQDLSATEHAERVAWLVENWVNDGSDPPVLEVDEWECVTVDDGWHRLHAVALRADPVVLVEVGGYLDAAEVALGVLIA